MVVGRVAPSSHLFDIGSGRRPNRQAVLASQVERHLEDLFATGVDATMAVEVGRLQAKIQNAFDLGAILPLQLTHIDLVQELLDARGGVEIPRFVYQRRHLRTTGYRAPPVSGLFAHRRQVDGEGNIGHLLQPCEGMERPRARDHHAAGADDASLKRADNGFVDGVAHPEIIGVDQQQAGIVGISQEAVYLAGILRAHRATLLYKAHSSRYRYHEDVSTTVTAASTENGYCSLSAMTVGAATRGTHDPPRQG